MNPVCSCCASCVAVWFLWFLRLPRDMGGQRLNERCILCGAKTSDCKFSIKACGSLIPPGLMMMLSGISLFGVTFVCVCQSTIRGLRLSWPRFQQNSIWWHGLDELSVGVSAWGKEDAAWLYPGSGASKVVTWRGWIDAFTSHLPAA